MLAFIEVLQHLWAVALREKDSFAKHAGFASFLWARGTLIL
jgi:hypothetical protein